MDEYLLKVAVKNAVKEALNSFDHGELNLPLGSRARGGDINKQLNKYKAEEEKKEKQKIRDSSLKTKSAGIEAGDYEKYINIMVEDVARKRGASFDKKEAKETLISMMKHQPQKFVNLMKNFKASKGL